MDQSHQVIKGGSTSSSFKAAHSSLPNYGNKCIVHIDLDAFYCAVEHVRLGIPLSTPLAVQQWSGLIAINHAARALGLRKSMNVQEGLKVCPSLRLVHVATFANGETEAKYHEGKGVSPHTHKVSLDVYRKASTKVMRIFKRFCPRFQRASIDEAYLDLTSQVEAELEQHYPNLLSNSKAAANVSVPWDISKTAILGLPFSDADTQIPTTHGIDDLRLKIASEICSKIRGCVFDEEGYTCSAGISPNKIVSKIISAVNKPNKQTVILSCHVLDYMKDVPILKIPGLGGKLGERVLELGEQLEKAGDLWHFSKEALAHHFGEETGYWIYQICRGICFEEVVEVDMVKSMGSNKAIRPPAKNVDQVGHWLTVLCAELYSRILDEVEINHRFPRHCSVKVNGRSQVVPMPSEGQLTSLEVLLRRVRPVIQESDFPIALIGVTLSQFSPVSRNATLDSWFKKAGSSNPSNFKKKIAVESRTKNVPADETIIHVIDSDSDQEGNISTIPCSTCGNAIGTDERSKQEHADYHFALSLHDDAGFSAGLPNSDLESGPGRVTKMASQEAPPEKVASSTLKGSGFGHSQDNHDSDISKSTSALKRGRYAPPSSSPKKKGRAPSLLDYFSSVGNKGKEEPKH